MRTAFVCLLLCAVSISADLQSDIDDIETHYPIKEIISIGQKYVAADPSYADELRYLQKVNFEKLFKNNFLQTTEGQELITYFNNSGINAENVFLHIAKKSTEIIDKWLEPIKDGEELNTVISGDIMEDYLFAIRNSDFFIVLQKKFETGSEIGNLDNAIKGPQYHCISYSARKSKGLLSHGESADEVRTLWRKVWKVTKAVCMGGFILNYEY